MTCSLRIIVAIHITYITAKERGYIHSLSIPFKMNAGRFHFCFVFLYTLLLLLLSNYGEINSVILYSYNDSAFITLYSIVLLGRGNITRKKHSVYK